MKKVTGGGVDITKEEFPAKKEIVYLKPIKESDLEELKIELKFKL
jgi:hypothetical protein